MNFLFVFCLLFGALARPARLTSPTSPYWTYLNPEWGGAGSLSLLPRGPSCKRSWSDLYIEIQIHIFRNLLIRFNSLVAFTMCHVATRRSHICSDNRSKDGAHVATRRSHICSDNRSKDGAHACFFLRDW